MSEEQFFCREFELSDEPEQIKNNYIKALSLYFNRYYAAHLIAIRLFDGEVIQDVYAKKITELLYAYHAYCDFRVILRPDEEPINLNDLGFPEASENLMHKSEELLSSCCTNLYDFEKGKWYDFLYRCEHSK